MSNARDARPTDEDPPTLEALNRLIAASEPPGPGVGRPVLGEGPIGARIAFIGERPGDQEDRQGRPFVGPTGQLLNQTLTEAGIDRAEVYITGAVKRFRFELRGKKRIHQRPTAGEVKRDRWWLFKELSFVQPRLVVALGATAALALTGKPVQVTKARGVARFGDFDGYITVHPSYLLRIPDPAARSAAYEAFCADLRRIRALAAR
jgi:uracil-DNA glycosylase